MGADQFPIEGPVAAGSLVAETEAPIAAEAWSDQNVLVYSSADGKLHPAAAPAGSLPTGSGNLFVATPANGSSGTSALRSVVVADIATALAAGGGAVAGTVITASTRVESPTIGTGSAAQHALPSGTAELLSADSTATVTNKSIDAAQLTGSLADARLSANVVTLTGSQTLTNKSIAASQLTGVVAAANGGSTTGTNGASVQVTGTVNLGGSATWTDVTLSVALPGTGTYIIYAAIRSVLVMTSGLGAISFKLVNATAGTDIADSIRVGPYGVSLTQNVATANLFALVSIVGAATIKVQASCAAFGGTYSTTNVVSDSSLATNQMHYVQIA